MKNLNIEKKEGSRVCITAELPWEDFVVYRPTALKNIGEVLSVDGFRKGHIPDDIIVKQAGESAILEEMANLAFQKLYPQIIRDNKIDAIGRPEIQITKLASGNPLGFSITTSVMPEIVLPDYKKIASQTNSKKEEVKVSDEDIEKTIEEIRTMRAKQDLFKKMQNGDADHVHDDSCNHDHEEIPNNKDESVEDVQKRIDEKLVLPEFNDEFVKTLGDFANVEDFKTKLRENILNDKKQKSEDKTRIDSIEAIIAETKLDLPDIIVDVELDQMISRMTADVSQMGMKFEDYLIKVGKTEEDIRKEFRPDAEKRAKIQIIVADIAKKENIIPDAEKVAQELEIIKQHYPEVDEKSARGYVETILTNDAVFAMLAGQK